MPLEDERRLVEEAQAGDGEAFGQLYEAYFDRVYRFIYFRVADLEVAEDLASQVFLKAWENLHRYRPRGPFLAWLYAIARNTVIDTYRTRKPVLPLDEAAPIPSREASPDEQLQLQFEVKALREAILCLTPEQQEVITLKFIADYDTTEIAREMGKSEGAVRALQMRALQALARAMKKNHD